MAGLLSAIGKFFGNKSDKDIKEIKPKIEKINEEYSKLNSLTHDELRGKTDVFKNRIIQIYIFHGKNKILSEDEIKLIGSHNMVNICSSLCVILSLGLNIKEAANHIKNFQPIEHRMESFYNDGRISWINDSKATNVASTISAVNSLDENIILILGGKPKEDDYGKLNEVINTKVKHLIIYGESRNLLCKQIDAKNKPIEVANVKDAVVMAKKIVKKSMNSNSKSVSILLSPACSSYDMFKSYEERGLYFKKCVFE